MMDLDVSMFRKAQVFDWALGAARVSWAPFWHLRTDCLYDCMMKLDVSMFRKGQVDGVALEAPRVSWAPFWHLLTAFGRPFLEDFGARNRTWQAVQHKCG